MFQVLQGIEHGFQMPAGELVIEVLGETFEIDIGGIHVRIEFLARFGRDITGGDRHGFDTHRMTGLGDINGIFMKDYRVVVGIGNTLTTQSLRRLRDHLGRGLIGEGIDLARLADIPVLAKLAGQVTTGRAKRQDGGARQKMIQGFLFNGIDAKTAGAAIGCQHHGLAHTAAHKAQTTLAIMELAKTWTQIALDAVIVKFMPVSHGPGGACIDRGVGHLFRSLDVCG
jgi:hypothetical protein